MKICLIEGRNSIQAFHLPGLSEASAMATLETERQGDGLFL